MQFTLMSLPFDKAALEPYISSETISYHYGKHHTGYVNKLNALLEESDYVDKPLEHIIKYASGALFNNAAQVYNHDFYWNGLTNASSNCSVELSDMITTAFGSQDDFKKLFLEKAATLFGSGWIWLVVTQEGTLSVEQYSNADNPLRHDQIPLLTCDVWEHAYYIDYRNGRAEYLENWWKLINWQFVSDNLAKVENDPMTGYAQPCNDNNEVCDYVDVMQENERTQS
jgi:superoxide dismutase, Fe-Mn family